MSKFTKHLFFLIASIGLSTALAQPLHQPIPNYTNDGSVNRTGHATKFTNLGCGYMENAMGGVAVNGNVHFQARNEPCLFPNNGGIVVETKNATNGQHLNDYSINIGVYRGQPASTDLCFGMTLDPALNRAYVFGMSSLAGGFIMCLDMNTLSPVMSFGLNGVATAETNATVTGLVLTGTSNNFLVSVNAKNIFNQSIIKLKEYTSGFVLNTSLTLNGSSFGVQYESAYSGIKKAPNGRYFMVGKSINNSTSVKYPVLWDIAYNSGTYSLYSNSNPSSSPLGQGEFVDLDFYTDPTNTTTGYLFDVYTVGNNSSTIGIYGRYKVTTTPTNYTPDGNYKNQSSLPGIAIPANSANQAIKYTRCTMASNGYLSVLGYYTNTNSERAIMGHINPSGSQYNTTYMTPTVPGSIPVHKTRGLVKDNAGNILISGCTTGEGYTIVKLSNNYDCMPKFNLKGSTPQLCYGETGILNVNLNLATPNCTIIWKNLSTNTVIYTGIPFSLNVYPTVTTTYECTVINNDTGCSAVMTYTITVLPTSPGFSVSTNTSNSGYFTLSAIANQTNSNTVPGFGFAWFVEELNSSNAVICTFSNPSCWWYPLTTPNPFNGIDFVANSYSGNVTISNCNVPTVGKFLYGRKYRITRGTWSTDCDWAQQSVIIQINNIQNPEDPTGLAINSEGETVVFFSEVSDENVPNFLELTQQEIAQLVVAPNPSNGLFTITSSVPFESAAYIYDASGKLVAQQQAEGLTEQHIDLTYLTKGIYFLKVAVSGALRTEKLIID